MKMKNLSIAALLFFTLAAFTFMQSCTPKAKPIEPSQLEGYWVLKTLNGQDAKTLFEGSLPTLQFDFKEMRVSGTGGCNRYTGSFTFENNVLNTPDLAMTKMACLGKNEEGQFIVEMSRPKTVSIVNNILTFSADGDEVTLEFEKGEAPVVETVFDKLSGTWTLTKMEGTPVADIFKGEEAKIPTLTFNFDDNRASGNAGCNGYSAPFVYDNGLIIVSLAAATQMACPNLKGESQYLKNFVDTMGVSIPDANTLQLIKKGNMILEYTK